MPTVQITPPPNVCKRLVVEDVDVHEAPSVDLRSKW
jgi:hypothetical protein